MPPDEPFESTRWSLILAAREAGAPGARAALDELCQTYWQPLYSFIRHRGHDPHSAEDLTQEFFARLLESEDLAKVDRSKGRFRAFLLAACTHFLSNERDRARARKRGGDRRILSIDVADAERRYGMEPSHSLTSEALFTRRWALTLLDQTIESLRAEYTRIGQRERFEVLQPAIAGKGIPYAELGARLDTSEGAVQVAVHRLRKRYREVLRSRIADTLDDPAQIDDEIRDLFTALSAAKSEG